MEDFKNNKQKNNTEPGRKSNKIYHFCPNYQLYNKYGFKILSKQRILKLMGSIPSPPGLQPDKSKFKNEKSWQIAADKYGAYILFLFKPETYNDILQKNHDYNWNNFQQYINKISNSDILLDKYRLVSIKRITKAFKTDSKSRKLLNLYRGSTRTLWSEKEKKL